MEHKKPSGFTDKTWRTCIRLIVFVGTIDGVFEYERKRPLTMREIAFGIERSFERTKQIVGFMVSRRVIGRQVEHFGPQGVMTWVCPPHQQIDFVEPPRTPRVAAVLPAIRQALRDDRESLRAVASRYGVSADTVQDERRKIAPFDPGSAQVRRCKGCGALINSPRCLRCTLVL